MKKQLIYIIAFVCFGNLSHAQINIASGGNGTTTGVGQSFNETRGVDATVISLTDLTIQSITLGGFFSGLNGMGTAYLGVRIYNSSNYALLASSPFDTVSNIMGGSVTIPINFTLVSGNTYRISIFCGGPNPPTQNSALMYSPASFPYTETSNKLTIVHAWAYPADTVPVTTNIFVPLMTINTIATGIEWPTIESEIIISYNRADENITIVNSKQDQVEITCIDVSGKILGTIKVPVRGRSNLDISSYPDFFFVKTSDGFVTKIVK